MANPRTGDKCPIKCKGYPIRQCPICTCSCNMYATEDDFRDIAAVETLDVEPEEPQDETRIWLDNNLNINVVQRQQSARTYSERMTKGLLSKRSLVVSNVCNEGAVAQSLSMVGNPPSQRVAAVLRKKIDNMQHPNGKTLVNIGHQIVDLRSHGRNSAADVRASNNGLVGTGNYCDDISSAIAASLASLKPVDCSNDDGLTEAEQDWFARDNIKPPVLLKMSAANVDDDGGGKMPARQRADDDGGGKMPAHRGKMPARQRGGLPLPKVPAGWPLVSDSPRGRMWRRTKRANALSKHVDKDKSELTATQKRLFCQIISLLKQIITRTV